MASKGRGARGGVSVGLVVNIPVCGAWCVNTPNVNSTGEVMLGHGFTAAFRVVYGARCLV